MAQAPVEAFALIVKPTAAPVLFADQGAQGGREAGVDSVLADNILQRSGKHVRLHVGGHHGQVDEDRQQLHRRRGRGAGSRMRAAATRGGPGRLGLVPSQVCHHLHGQGRQWRQWVASATSTPSAGGARRGVERADEASARAALRAVAALQELVHAGVRAEAQSQRVKQERQLPQALAGLAQAKTADWASRGGGLQAGEQVIHRGQQPAMTIHVQQHGARLRHPLRQRPRHDQPQRQCRMRCELCGMVLLPALRSRL
mmetsp:Transcript_83270/g.220885  ORF Transcript_83270/g.220885 Transcript_83270/m.220885 type:complete len:257 (+) Transcript_83270:454-1224(+)